MTAVALGTVTITGEFGGQSGSLDLVVLPLYSMVIHLGDGSDPNGRSLVEGTRLELIGRIFWENGQGTELEPEWCTWPSRDTSVMTVSIVGIRAVAAGTAMITAIYS